MARARNILGIEGSLDELCFYMLNGKPVVRRVGRVSKEFFKHSHSFGVVRNNVSEFGAASGIGKLLRLGLSPFSKKWADPYISGRLTSSIKSIICFGAGAHGKRAFDVVRFGSLLEGFDLNANRSFSSVVHGGFAAPVFDPVLNRVSVSFSGAPSLLFSAPASASHFRLVSACCFLPNFSFSSGNYAAVSNASFRSYAAGDWVELANVSSSSVFCELGDFVFPSGMGGLVCAVGVEFGVFDADDFYPLADSRVMFICKVFV